MWPGVKQIVARKKYLKTHYLQMSKKKCVSLVHNFKVCKSLIIILSPIIKGDGEIDTGGCIRPKVFDTPDLYDAYSVPLS